MKAAHYLLATPLGTLAAAVPGPIVVNNTLIPNVITPKAGKSFSLCEEHNLDYTGGDAPMEMIRAHSKFTKSLSPWVANMIASNPDMNSKFNSYVQQGIACPP